MGATIQTKKESDTYWREFECPECTAHNPWDDGYAIGDELFCSWCGAVLIVRKMLEDPHRCKIQVE